MRAYAMLQEERFIQAAAKQHEEWQEQQRKILRRLTRQRRMAESAALAKQIKEQQRRHAEAEAVHTATQASLGPWAVRRYTGGCAGL